MAGKEFTITNITSYDEIHELALDSLYEEDPESPYFLEETDDDERWEILQEYIDLVRLHYFDEINTPNELMDWWEAKNLEADPEASSYYNKVSSETNWVATFEKVWEAADTTNDLWMNIITPQEVNNVISAGVDFRYFTGIDISEYITLRDLNKLARQLDKEDGEDIIRSYVNRLKSNISITRQNNEDYIKLIDAERLLKVVAGNEGKELLQNYIKQREVEAQYEWR